MFTRESANIKLIKLTRKIIYLLDEEDEEREEGRVLFSLICAEISLNKINTKNFT